MSYIRKSPCKKVRSVPTENERKAEAVPFHENQNHKTLFLWIPITSRWPTAPSASYCLSQISPHGRSLPVSTCWSTVLGWFAYRNLQKAALRFLAFSFYRASLPTSFSAFCSSVPSPQSGQILAVTNPSSCFHGWHLHLLLPWMTHLADFSGP